MNIWREGEDETRTARAVAPRRIQTQNESVMPKAKVRQPEMRIYWKGSDKRAMKGNKADNEALSHTLLRHHFAPMYCKQIHQLIVIAVANMPSLRRGQVLVVRSIWTITVDTGVDVRLPVCRGRRR